MNFVNRYFYWNMNYHVEHHMYPLVPYHALPRLHEAVKDDCPTPYTSICDAWREIIPALARQIKDPAYHVKRQLPPPQLACAKLHSSRLASPMPQAGWRFAPHAGFRACRCGRFDHGHRRSLSTATRRARFTQLMVSARTATRISPTDW